ncbi:MAG: TetR/AcrR family transcriptional regulator [Segniliparus sp.]|uniref:TetR/AcrR family transcriptional regulator n=1 Tax=Segniliparus sp. TaxID=2804064 RepID=UPI003F37827A
MSRDTRSKMVRSAAVMLRRHGIHGTSFGKVLEHSGAPRGSISHHFPGGKTEMIVAAVEAAGEEVAAQLRGLVAAGASASDLVAGVCGYFEHGLAQTDFRAGCPVAAAAYEGYDIPELRESARAAIEKWTTALAGSLRAEGRPETEAEALAQVCVAAIEGAVMMARVQRSTRPIDTVRAQLVALTTP